MPWRLTTDVAEFQTSAGAFLAGNPVENAPLLTETAYLAAVPGSREGLLLGAWTDDAGTVRGALVRAPRHNPLLTDMPREALVQLAAELPGPPGLGVPEHLATDAIAAWQQAGTMLTPRQAFTVHRLGELATRRPPTGRARAAVASDRALLHRWFDELMAALPGDPSDRAYVIDDPLEFGGLVLWEVDDAPVAMCGRSRTVAGTVRLGPCYAPDGNAANAEAAFMAACAAATRAARHVLVLAPTTADEEARRLARAGFVPAATRVALAPR